MTYTFSTKWGKMRLEAERADESTLFVSDGKVPETQRQLNLYHYFLFVRDRLAGRPVRDVIEVGCGRGTLALYLATNLGLNLTLLDDSADAIEIAKREFAREGAAGTFLVRDALATGLPDASFDAAVSIGLAEHFDGPRVRELFREQFRILRPGGVMISLNIPKKFSIQFLNLLLRAVKKLAGTYKRPLGSDYFRNDLSPAEYKAAAKEAGFTGLETVAVCPFPLFTPVALSTDRRIASLYRGILALRRAFMGYPYKTNPLVAQAHFLVARKPA